MSTEQERNAMLEQELLDMLDGDQAGLQRIKKAIGKYKTFRALARTGAAFVSETPKTIKKDADDLHDALATIQRVIEKDSTAWENYQMTARHAGFSKVVEMLTETIGPLVHMAKEDADDAATLVRRGRKKELEVIARQMILLSVWEAMPSLADKKQHRKIAIKAYELANIIGPDDRPKHGAEPRGTEIFRNDLKDEFVKDLLHRAGMN